MRCPQARVKVTNKGLLRDERGKLLMRLEDKYQVLALIFPAVGELRKGRRGREGVVVKTDLLKPEGWGCFCATAHRAGFIWVLTKGLLFFHVWL